MNFHNVLNSTANGIATVTVNRPDKLNALNMATIDEIGKAMDAAMADPAVGGVILTGAGPKAFVAGADISEFLSYTVEQAVALSKQGHDVFTAIERAPKPVVAAINGFALGGGLELAMGCHLRIAASNAKFGQPEVNLGLIPGYGGTQRLVRLIGRSKATELLMTADMIGAEDALRLGLVNEVVPKEELMASCQAMLAKIMNKSPNAIAEIIRCVNANYEGNGMQTEIERFAACFGTDDFKEGVTAFLEKRKAAFTRS